MFFFSSHAFSGDSYFGSPPPKIGNFRDADASWNRTEQYALTIAGYLTVRLLQRFDAIEAVDNLETIPQFVTVTLEAKQGVKVRLRKAASS